FRAFEVKGNSMIPTLFGKDIVVCSKKESLSNIKSGRVYVVVLNDGSIVVKRLSKLGLHYTAISDNDEEYPSYTIEAQEIFEVWEVEARITGNLEEKSKNENNAFKELEKRLQKLELIIGK
ncbi:MAG: helix-turn-helix transcriptional regulator, partial [Bacteroidota bacterium]